jgi:hypothetical protein
MSYEGFKPSIVFAHGLWAGGSCFSKLIPELRADGHEVFAAQNSLVTREGDAGAARKIVCSPTVGRSDQTRTLLQAVHPKLYNNRLPWEHGA